jgi:peroxiredoxin
MENLKETLYKPMYNKNISWTDGGRMSQINIGDQAPDFTLLSHLDKNITLSSLRGKTIVLAFFPQAWTPI